MKAKLALILFLSLAVAPVAVWARAKSEEGSIQPQPSQSSAAALENPAPTNLPTTPTAAPRGPQQELQDYEAAMMVVTQRFSATLAGIVEAVHRGQLSSAQGQKLSAAQYQLTQMQCRTARCVA